MELVFGDIFMGILGLLFLVTLGAIVAMLWVELIRVWKGKL